MGLPIDPETGKTIVQGYVPNNALTIAAMAAFGAIAVACMFRFFRSGRPRYMLWTVIGSILMAGGFAVRIKVHSDPTSIPIYAISNLLILVAPCAFIAQDYYILPHLATWLGAEDCLFLKARLVGRIFIVSDGITFFLQLSGSGLTAKADTASVGNTIALIGLIAQLISFGIFMLLGALFIVRLRRFHPSIVSDESRLGTKFGQLRDWRTVLLALAWTCVGILIRCVFRVIEFSQGYDGTLRTTEWCFYVFDTLPLLAAIAVWVFVWPPSALAEPALGQYALSSASFAPKDGYPPISRV